MAVWLNHRRAQPSAAPASPRFSRQTLALELTEVTRAAKAECLTHRIPVNSDQPGFIIIDQLAQPTQCGACLGPVHQFGLGGGR